MNPPDAVPTAQEFGLLVAYLVQHPPAGMTPGQWNQQIAAIVGSSPAGRTRRQIAADLIAWLKDRPHA